MKYFLHFLPGLHNFSTRDVQVNWCSENNNSLPCINEFLAVLSTFIA